VGGLELAHRSNDFQEKPADSLRVLQGSHVVVSNRTSGILFESYLLRDAKQVRLIGGCGLLFGMLAFTLRGVRRR
jgi:hypothetical protein